MRILAFNYEYPPLGGGGGVVFQALCEEWAKQHDVVVVTSHFRGLDRVEKRGRLEIHRIPVLMRTSLPTATMPSLLSYVPASIRYGQRLLKERSFDLIHSQFVVPSAPGAQKLATRHRLPHVLTILGGDVYDPSKSTSPHRVPLVRGTVRRLLNAADRVLAGSTDVAESARRWYGVTRDIQVIPLAIAEPPPAPRDRARLGLPDDAFVLVTVGRLVTRKGLEELLSVLKSVDDPRQHLLIVGDGPLKDTLEARARELGLSARVRLLGRVSEEDKWLALGSADAYVSTSMHEGFGLVFLEGMHAGLPVVAYDHGGQTDFLDDDVTGAVIPLGDTVRFGEAIRRLREDDAFRGTCSANNRMRVRDYYADRCAQRYIAAFESTIAAART